MDLLRWGGFTFCVRHDRVLGFKDLSINATCETEDKESGGEKYITKKSGKAAEVTLTALLNARLGVNVQQEAQAMQDAARTGKTDYMYTATAKLFPCLLMLTGAKISNPKLSPRGTWLSCEVALTFKQASKWDGSTSSSSGKKKKKKKKNTPQSDTQATAAHFADHTELTKLTRDAQQQSADMLTNKMKNKTANKPAKFTESNRKGG